MGYDLGVDLGTTFTAAAVSRDGRVEMASLGDRAAAVPSVVLLRADGTVLTGDAADRRAATEPDRVAREVKRRLGDPLPVLLGGAPQPVQELMAMQLRDVVRVVSEREGGDPDRVTLTHPANWGPYKRELFGQIPRRAGLDRVRMLSEPEAAAAHYASSERVPDGAVVAVYDLGGGTFDATVLRTSGDGFEILGTPEGIEGLGGIDFDEAVYAHVDRALDGALADLDPADIRATSAAIRLRHECVLAKEALSADTETTIPVLLPAVQTEVRLTRGEFEAMVAPSITATVEAMRRALRSAGVTADELHTVLLVGGSSRIPVVARTVSAELGRPTSVDAHPKHAIALGAAASASRGDAAAVGTPDDPTTVGQDPRGARPFGPDDVATPPGGIPRGPVPQGAPLGMAAFGAAGVYAAGHGGGPSGGPSGGHGTGYGPGGHGNPGGPSGTAPMGAVPGGGPGTGPMGAVPGPGTGPTAVVPGGGPGTGPTAAVPAGLTPAGHGAAPGPGARPEAGAPPPSLQAPTSPKKRGRRIGVAVGAGLVVAAGAVVAALFFSGVMGGSAVADPTPAGATVATVEPTTTEEAPVTEEPAAAEPEDGSGDTPQVRTTPDRPAPVRPANPPHRGSTSSTKSSTWTSSSSETSSSESTTDPGSGQ